LAPMPDPRRFEIEDLVNRPGTYFNPHTEVLIVVDDSAEADAEVFTQEGFEGADWVLITDETPVDEHRRDELLERFQVQHHAGGVAADVDEPTDDLEEDEPELDAE
jgi:hypothetical protein